MGRPLVRLQPQSQTVFDSSGLNCTGVSPVPLWEPSQKGWVLLRPQAHQK